MPCLLEQIGKELFEHGTLTNAAALGDVAQNNALIGVSQIEAARFEIWVQRQAGHPAPGKKVLPRFRDRFSAINLKARVSKLGKRKRKEFELKRSAGKMRSELAREQLGI